METSVLKTTPIRKRISTSPRKPKFRPPTSDSYPPIYSAIEAKQQQPVTLAEVEVEVPFSYFDDEKKQFTMLSHAQSVQLLNILRLHFNEVLSIIPIAPFLVIECDKSIPDPATTPFLIAGLIACFVIQGDPYPFGIDFIGDDGRAEGLLETDVPEEIWGDIKPFHIPTIKTFEWIHKQIQETTHVSSYPQQLVVELQKMTDEEFEAALDKLPDTIGCLNVGYINGPLLAKKHAPQQTPNPRLIDGEYDDTDYLDPRNGGMLKPGMLLECAGVVDENHVRNESMLTNTGIKVKKGELVRVTVAHHGWDAVDNKAVYHPSRTGHHVGNIEGFLGEDIGLLNCTKAFSNQFPDLPTKAKSLLHSSQLKWGQFVVIDSCFTGVQRLKALGVRTGAYRVTSSASLVQPPVPGPSEDHWYVKVDQGIFGVKTAAISREPRIREGVCGSPLILAGKSQREIQSFLADGMISGFMLWSDIVGRYNTDGHIYSFCQPADPLIEGGWSVHNE